MVEVLKVPALAAPQLGSCASSGRAWRLWAARHSQEEAGPLGAQPLPRLPEPAASKAAHFHRVWPIQKLQTEHVQLKSKCADLTRELQLRKEVVQAVERERDTVADLVRQLREIIDEEQQARRESGPSGQG